MLPTTNILDQLLGGFDVKTSGTSGGSGVTGAADPFGLFGPSGAEGVASEGNPLGLLFGDLLTQVVEGAETVGKSSQQQQIEVMFPSIDRPQAQEEATAGPTVERNLWPLRTDASVQLNLEADPTTDPEAALPIKAAGDPEVGRNDVDIALSRRPDLILALSQRALATVPGQPIDLEAIGQVDALSLLPTDDDAESAVYRVLDSKVSGGRLELTVAAEGQSSDPVKISLPAAPLTESPLKTNDNNAKASTGRPSRVPLEGVSAGTPNRIDDLLARLNLKTLEIKVEPDPAPAKAPNTPVQITLVAENDGAQVALKGKIVAQDIQVKTTRRESEAALSGSAGKSSAVTAEPTLVKPVTLDSLTDPLRRNGNLMDFNLTDRFGKSHGQPVTPPELTPAGAAPDRALAADFTTDHKLTPTVKMSLPDTIQKPFAANGQTLLIRIEPEHLGPARLSLSVRDHMLTARVMVDTPMARLAVQNSLDQLTDQLARAGIDVDRIEVSLSGDDGRGQFADQRPAWSHARKTRHYNDDVETGPEIVAAAQAVPASPTLYIGADRVNLWA